MNKFQNDLIGRKQAAQVLSRPVAGAPEMDIPARLAGLFRFGHGGWCPCGCGMEVIGLALVNPAQKFRADFRQWGSPQVLESMTGTRREIEARRVALEGQIEWDGEVHPWVADLRPL